MTSKNTTVEIIIAIIFGIIAIIFKIIAIICFNAFADWI